LEKVVQLEKCDGLLEIEIGPEPEGLFDIFFA
jgi:hypothetical protein